MPGQRANGPPPLPPLHQRYYKTMTLPALPPMSLHLPLPLPPPPGHQQHLMQVQAQAARASMRTPAAWYHRDVNLTRPASALPQMSSNYNTLQANHRPSHRSHQLRPSSPSVTTTSSDDREEIPMVRSPRRPNSRHTVRGQTMDRRSVMSRTSRAPSQGQGMLPPHLVMSHYDMVTYGPPPGPPPQGHPFRTGTLRSSRSVPALALTTYDGEPCPVHGQCSGGPANQMQPIYSPPEGIPLRRFGSVMDVRGMAPNVFPLLNLMPPALNGEKKYPGNSVPFPGPGPQPMGNLHHMSSPFLSQGFHPRGMVVPAFPEQHGRDPFKVAPTVSSHGVVNKGVNRGEEYEEVVCCKGHLIVLWIILGVVTVGVISGIVLGVTMN